MRVILNGLAALKPRTGVGHHVAHLARALKAGFPADRIDVYPGPLVAALVRRAQAGRRAAGPAAAGAGGRGGRVQAALKAAAKAAAARHFQVASRGADLYHEPNFVPFPSRLPTVVTVHDLSVVKHPDWHPADRVQAHAKHFRAAVERAAHVIVVSDAVRAELIAFAGLPEDRVTTVTNGTDPAMRPLPRSEVDTVLARLNLPARFFLTAGTVEPRKNLLTAMRAFVMLPAELRAACPLVLAGPWGWRADAERDYFLAHAAPAGARHAGYVSAADLPAVFNAAVALVYPSFYEGFGLPPVEMLAVRGRVLAADSAAAVREVCGPFADTLPAADPDAWAAAMARAADAGPPGDGPARAAHAAAFTWERAARETMAVYRRVLG